MARSPLLTQRQQAALVVVDVQDRLWPAMDRKEALLQNVLRLTKGAGVLGIPITVTEQYRKGLGATVAELAATVPGFSPLEKLAFSACGADGFIEGLRSQQVRDVMLCGIEAHVCVSQTCLDLLSEGFGCLSLPTRWGHERRRITKPASSACRPPAGCS